MLSDAGKRWAADQLGDRSLHAEQEPDAAERINGHGVIPPPPEPPTDDDPGQELTPEDPEAEPAADDEPTTWEPLDLGPYLRGEIVQPETCLGITRSDGLRLIYPRREHAVIGETESGKSWLALACVAAELAAGQYVVYIHYEEADATSTVERLTLLGVSGPVIDTRLRFVGPSRPVRAEWLEPLLDPPPTLVVHDGVNEAMSLHGAEIKDVDGASVFRRRLIVPCLRAGAATLACDHLPMGSDASRRDAYGSVHKGNALDGARILLENTKPFGRRMRGVSHVFVTKDRPGHLRAQGRPTKIPGRTYMGTLVADDSQSVGPDFVLGFYAPRDDDQPADTGGIAAEVADIVYDVIAALPDHQVASMDLLYAEIRKAGHQVRDRAVREAIADLTVEMRVIEKRGKRNAKGFQAVLTSAQESDDA
jgi:hypothetical protein